LWLLEELDMETLDWSNVIVVGVAKQYSDKYVRAWNLCDTHLPNVIIPQILNEDPYH